MQKLNVYLKNRLVGILIQENGQLSFQYDSEYLKCPDALPISYSLPLSALPFTHQLTPIFFENMLPPEAVRKKFGKILPTLLHNIFGFLHAIRSEEHTSALQSHSVMS